MEQISAQQHLKALQARWTESDSSAAEVTANALNDVIRSIFGDPVRIGYELLQNADDAALGELDNQLTAEVEYVLLDKHLIVQHNGKHFGRQDVNAICHYGASRIQTQVTGAEQTKQRDMNKIGYKGIGFKSVFNLANRVWVISNPYNFKFDKFYWEELDKQLPWQITPILYEKEELPQAVQNQLRPNWVSFVLELTNTDRDKVKKPIAKLFNTKEVVLFLRHIGAVSMHLQVKGSEDIVCYRKIKRSKEDHVFKLEKYEIQSKESPEVSFWHLATFKFEIPKEVSATLQNLDKGQCPEKLKSTTEAEITFGAKLKEDNTIEMLSRPKLFSYLPTDKVYEFPFLVNANFLMNEARTDLLDLNWNEFVFEQIGYHQFAWFEKLASDSRFKYESANLLVRYSDGNNSRRNRRLNQGADRAKDEIAFVPVLESRALRKAPETVIDQTGVSAGLDDTAIVRDGFTEALAVVDPRMKSLERLLKIGARAFDREKLLQAIRQANRYMNPKDNARLISFLFRRTTKGCGIREQNEWMSALHKTPFVLNQQGELRCPHELYLSSDMPELPFELSMEFLHAEIYQGIVISNPKLERWLQQLELSSPSPTAIIRKGVFPLIANDAISHNMLIPIARYLFDHASNLESQDFKQLAMLPVLTTHGATHKVSSTYLSEAYKPKLPIEHLVQEDIFISSDYLLPQEEPEAWNDFWRKLSARQEMSVDFYRKKISPEGLLEKYPAYYNFVRDYLPQHDKTKVHDFVNFVIPRYISYCGEYDFALNYWTIILEEKWHDVRHKCSRCSFEHSGGKTSIPSFFQFLALTNAYLPAKDGQCYPTSEVFSQDIAHLVGNLRPISAFPMSKEQEDFWGVNHELDLKTCLGLLQEIALDRHSDVDKKVITGIYDYLLRRRFTEKDLEICGEAFSSLRLKAVDNSFQPMANLYYLSIPSFAAISDSNKFIFLDLPEERSRLFSKLFQLKELSVEDMRVVTTLPKTDNRNDFRNRLLDRIPIISAFVAHQTEADFSDVQNNLAHRTDAIKFTTASAIELTLSIEGEELYRKSVRAWREKEQIYMLSPWDKSENKFELIDVLAYYFDVKPFIRELQLILELGQGEGLDWLESQGIELPTLPGPSEPPSTPITEHKPPTIKNGVNEPSTPIYEPISIDDAHQVGRTGEQYVFDKKRIQLYYKKHHIPITHVEWQNEKEESGSPYDFTVCLEDGSLHYWEVKSTPSPSKREFPMSEMELQFAIEKKDTYFLIRLQNINQSPVGEQILPNLFVYIEAGEVRIKGAVLEILLSTP